MSKRGIGMKWAAFIIVASILLLGGCVTIVLDEQGDAKKDEPPLATDEADSPVPVKIVDGPDPGAAAEQALPLKEVAQEHVAGPEEDGEGASESDAHAAEEKEYADERLADLKEEARRRGDAIPIDDFDSRETLEVLQLKVKKISPSRGSVEEILFVVRNFGDVPIHRRAEFRVETLITNPDFPRVERAEFDLKEIPPGMKIEKQAYLNIEFRPIDYTRKWNLVLLDRSTPPNEVDSIAGRFTLE